MTKKEELTKSADMICEIYKVIPWHTELRMTEEASKILADNYQRRKQIRYWDFLQWHFDTYWRDVHCGLWKDKTKPIQVQSLECIKFVYDRLKNDFIN